MKKVHNYVLALAILVGMMVAISCASEGDEYVGSTTPTVETTYLLTDFETGGNDVKEWQSVDYSPQEAAKIGYMYTFTDVACDNCTVPDKIYGFCDTPPVSSAESDAGFDASHLGSLAFRMEGNSVCNGSGVGGYFQQDDDDTGVLYSFEKMTRDFKSMDHEGAVFWAKGKGTIRFSLNMKQMVPWNKDENANGVWESPSVGEDRNSDGVIDDDSGDGGTCDPSSKCYDFHIMEFKIDGKWREYKVDFNDLRQRGFGPNVPFDINEVVAFQMTVLPVASNDAKNEFDLWIDNIGLYGGIKWDFVDWVEETDTGEDTDTGPAPVDTDTGTGTDTDTGTE